MITKTNRYRNTERAVTRILEEEGPQDSALSLVMRLEEAGHCEEMTRTAIWRLIDRGVAELTSDCKLRIREMQGEE
jgi:DNA-binding transcriptional regulator PaaX